MIECVRKAIGILQAHRRSGTTTLLAELLKRGKARVVVSGGTVGIDDRNEKDAITIWANMDGLDKKPILFDNATLLSMFTGIESSMMQMEELRDAHELLQKDIAATLENFAKDPILWAKARRMRP